MSLEPYRPYGENKYDIAWLLRASAPKFVGHGKRKPFFDPDDTHKMSPLFKSYLAGQLKLLPELLPFYAPTINSYKRLVEGHWAPTRVTWGVDNRTVAMRVIPRQF